MTTEITLQQKYTATPYQIQLNFQGKVMILWIQLIKYSAYYLLVVQFKANRYIINIKNTESSMISFSPGQTVAFLDWKFKCVLYDGPHFVITLHLCGSTHTCQRQCHMIPSPESLQKLIQKKNKYHCP